MEYNSSLPIYLQVANLIKRDIVTHHQSEYGQPCIQRA